MIVVLAYCFRMRYQQSGVGTYNSEEIEHVKAAIAFAHGNVRDLLNGHIVLYRICSGRIQTNEDNHAFTLTYVQLIIPLTG